MKIHNTGSKADRDRSILITSYNVMAKEFHARKLSASELARMSNTQIYQLSKDLYNMQSTEKVNKLAAKMGLTTKPPSIFDKIKAFFLKAVRYA